METNHFLKFFLNLQELYFLKEFIHSILVSISNRKYYQAQPYGFNMIYSVLLLITIIFFLHFPELQNSQRFIFLFRLRIVLFNLLIH